MKVRLGVDDWVGAAFELMADEGIAGVKLHRLCERLGVTKGSFYWHFADLDAFLGEVARQWRDGAGVVRIDVTEVLVAGDPRASLRRLLDLYVDRDLGRLERAMRDWARTDPRAREAVARADARALDAMTAGFLSLGLTQDEADVRAKLLFYAAVGYGDVGPIGSGGLVDHQVDILVDLLVR